MTITDNDNDNDNVLAALRLAMTSLRQIGRGEVSGSAERAAELAAKIIEQEYGPVVALLDASMPEDALFVAPRVDGTFLPDKALSGLRWAADNIATGFIGSEAFGFVYRCAACGETSDRPATIEHGEHCKVGYVVVALHETHALMSEQYEQARVLRRRIREATHAI